MPRTRCLSLSAVVTLVLILALPCLVAADTTIDTTTAWDGISHVLAFGQGSTLNYGQVITVPAGETSLESFTFYMNMPATVVFRGEVYAWDGTKATGTGLWEGAPRATSGSGSFEPITFETGGVAVTPGQQYILFATAAVDDGSGSGRWGWIPDSDTCPDGMFVYLHPYHNGAGDAGPDDWTVSDWYVNHGGDLAFQAVFSGGAQPAPTPPPEVPEPGSMLLLASGLAGLGGFGALRARLKR